MSSRAHVTSTQALRDLRVALIKFIEHGNVALMTGESDIDRTLAWLERDQSSYWPGQVRKRHEIVQQCEQAVRDKKLFKAFDGSTPSVVDEMKALALAKRRREEAEQKTLAVKKSIALLRRESLLYKGRLQRLASTLQGDLPRAVVALDQMLARLEEYLAVQSPGGGGGLAFDAALEQFTRAVTEAGSPPPVRERVPSIAARQAATPATALPGDFDVAGRLPDWQVQRLDSLATPLVLPLEQRVTVVVPTTASDRWILQHCTPVFEGDSGWCLYPAPVDEMSPTEPAPSPQTWAVWQLLQLVPACRSALTLPLGTLLMFDAHGIAAVLDGQDTDVWNAAVAPQQANAPPPDS